MTLQSTFEAIQKQSHNRKSTKKIMSHKFLLHQPEKLWEKARNSGQIYKKIHCAIKVSFTIADWNLILQKAYTASINNTSNLN